MTEYTWFRINPFIGEIKYNDKEAIILFATYNENTIQIEYDENKMIEIITSKGEINRLLLKCEDVNTKVKYYINEHQIYEHQINFNLNKVITFVSCDNYELDLKNSLWNEMECDICYHIGNNIYKDKCYKEDVKILKKFNKRQNEKIRKNKYLLEVPLKELELSYRECYQKTWSRWISNLPNTSHIFIEDNNNINNGNYISQVVKKLYQEYQEATRLDNGKYKHIYYSKINENVKTFLIDKTEESPFSDKLASLLDKKLNKINKGTVILIFTSTPLPNEKRHRGTWNLEEVKKLYNIMFSWMGKEKNKNILLIGGGLNIGVSGIIHFFDRNIPFFITSPISNQPRFMDKFYSRGYIDNYQLDQYNINVRQVRATRNYLKLSVEENGSVEGLLIFTDETLTSPMKIIKSLF